MLSSQESAFTQLVYVGNWLISVSVTCWLEPLGFHSGDVNSTPDPATDWLGDTGHIASLFHALVSTSLKWE